MKQIDHIAATDEIMAEEDFKKLAKLSLGLEKRIGMIDFALCRETESGRVAEYRADKRMAIALMELAKQRVKHLRDTTGRLNHNFRQLAREMLPTSQYEQIELLARQPLKKL